ncbi:MAG: tRNA (N(6)-L-threonylcarbamoyladenosine(37)-C(2))-methylthiotransferase MtaB [Acidobacteriota bacterium]|nr:tRNA (N(6)-L-threonylcarbamoyladenosine(37)-C(2))-methylthiotransferase MtaB [Acidobacteriota bacterium]
MKFSILTFGCRVNQSDSLRLEEDLRRRGGEPSSSADADVVVVNTCSVTATADQGARQAIRRVARENPAARIVATGCYATRSPDELASLPGVVRVVRNDLKLDLDQILGPSTAERFGDGEGPCGELIPGMAGRTAFTLRVQTGCDQPCSYCIIPTTRGKGRSLPPARVVAEATRVAAAGFKEVAITGVHLGSYGRDLDQPSSLFDLLIALATIDADVTFRISSLEPMDCTPEIVELVALSGGRFAPHFHLPLQHGSDRILRAMRRPYTMGFYDDLVATIVDALPHASIGTDMIVGFPGESDEDFAASLNYVSRAPLSHVHVFPYSDRPGTEASRLHDKVPGPVVRERGAALRRAAARQTMLFRDAQIGSIRPGLTLEDGTLVVTDNYLKVRIPAGQARNERVQVRLTSVTEGVVAS